MVKTTPASAEVIDPTEQLITEFIQFWEDHWSEAGHFDPSARAMIRAHLYLSVAKRYLLTCGGELHFTKKELKQAIRSAVEVVKQTRKKGRDDQVEGEICLRYICRLLDGWERREEFSEQELVAIRSKLFSDARDRYRNSGYSDLRVTKRELQKVVEMIESIRQRRERELRLDERDRRIRKGRREMGVLADSCTLLAD